MNLEAPRLLKEDDETAFFDCGENSLNIWLREKAQKNHKSGASKVFVISEGKRIAGFYCLSTFSIAHIVSPRSLTRNMPDPLPALLLGRLAIDKNYQGFGIGALLLQDAILRTLNISREIGLIGLVTNPLSERARSFYLKYGFIDCPGSNPTLILPIKTIEQALSRKQL